MATRFYLHAASSGVSGTLPSAKQSSLTIAKNMDAQTVNRTMTTTIGTSQASVTGTSLAQTASQSIYFTRFISDQLAAQTISANTWNVYFAASQSSGSANFPVSGTSKAIPITCYVWRPSTGAKVGNILDGNSVASFDEPVLPNTEYPKDGTFSGSSLAIQDGDVLCWEVIFTLVQGAATAFTITYYYDGTNSTVTEAAASANTSTASYIETPQNLSFYTPAITATPNLLTVTNKFITKI